MIVRLGVGLLPVCLIGCGGGGEHCFDGASDFSIAYEVELLERLPESNCARSVLEPGTTFTVVRTGYYAPAEPLCRKSILGLVAGLEDKDLVGIGYYPTGALPNSLLPVSPGGEAGFSIVVETPECRTRASMNGVSRVVGATADELAAQGSGLVWRVPIYECLQASQVQDDAVCTDYFTSRMKKVPWKLQY